MALINAVYHEYGDCLCLENAGRDLLDIDTYYIKAGGAVVVLDDAGHVRGTHAVLPEATRAKVCIFRRLYLEAALRGGPWGARLMQRAIAWAHAHSMHCVEFWSDTRFTRAHVFFARFGFQCAGRTCLWTTAAYRIKSIFSSSTCRQESWDEGKHDGITRDCGKHRGWKW